MVAHDGTTAAFPVIVNTRLPPQRKPPSGTQPAEGGAIARLASLVDDVVQRLEVAIEGEPPGEIVPACNAAIEECLERLRGPGARDDLVRTARDDLRRLSRLLKLVDAPDIPFVLRQIRRVLGRFDACGGGLVIDD